MKTAPPFWQSFSAAAVTALVLCFAPACKPSVPPAAPPKPVAPKLAAAPLPTNQLSAEYASVFEELMPPKGRDPFFPNSHRRDPVPVITASPDKPPPIAELVLKGIVGSPNHRLAVINNAILEAGESGAVRVPGGKVKVKCIKIGEDSAVVQVEGEIQPKRLELSKKGR